MRVAGIDCGKEGAISIIDSDEKKEVFFLCDAPIIKLDNGKTKIIKLADGKTKGGKKKIKTMYDIPLMNDLLSKYGIEYIFIENAQAMPGQGVSSMFSIGKGFGIWLGLIVGRGIPYETVSPRTWQKAFNIKGDSSKEQAYNTCLRLFQNLSTRLITIRGRIIDGRADATLIAEYGVRELRKKGQV